MNISQITNSDFAAIKMIGTPPGSGPILLLLFFFKEIKALQKLLFYLGNIFFSHKIPATTDTFLGSFPNGEVHKRVLNL